VVIAGLLRLDCGAIGRFRPQIVLAGGYFASWTLSLAAAALVFVAIMARAAGRRRVVGADVPGGCRHRCDLTPRWAVPYYLMDGAGRAVDVAIAGLAWHFKNGGGS
jgi:hypothetical protein